MPAPPLLPPVNLDPYRHIAPGSSALTTSTVINVIRYTGTPATPHAIKRRRQKSLQTMRRMGTPVLIKPMYTIQDVEEGIAVASANTDDVYTQPRHNDPLSYGVGFYSVATQPGEWVSPTGTLFLSPTSPGAGYSPAPKFRGYGQGYLTYAILPDAPEDIFKLTATGALIHTQQARIQMGWYPEVGDNDLLIVCEIDANENIIETNDRYQLKQVTPITMRGTDRRGISEGTRRVDGANRHVINQQAEMSLVPPNEILYQLETDR